jgi:hypothetical protein
MVRKPGLHLDDGTIPHVRALLEIGLFPTSQCDEITVSIRTNDPALEDYEGLDTKGLFPFLHDCFDQSSPESCMSPAKFVEGTEVMVKCLFGAYNIKGRTGYSFKLLEIFRVGADLNDGLILGDAPLFPKKRKIDKGKGREV